MKKGFILSALVLSLVFIFVACNDYSVHEYLLQHTVEFNACGGEVSTSKKTVLKDDIYGELPAPIRTGYVFLGWYTQQENGILVTAKSIVKDVDHETLYAHWKEAIYVVSFDLGYDCTPIPSINVQYMSYYGPLPTPERDGYVFCGWKNDIDNYVYSYTISDYTKDHTLTAQWTQNYVVSFTDDQYYTDTAESHIAGDKKTDSQSQTVAEYIVVTKGESCKLPNLNENVVRVGYTFEGWQEEGGEVLKSASNYTPNKASTVLKAVWSSNTVSVYLNAMGGNVGTNGKQVSFAQSYGELPDPSRTGFTFAGWYLSEAEASDKEESKKITEVSTVVTLTSHTLYAAWTPIVYNITYKDKDNAEFSGTHGTNYPEKHTFNSATPLVSAQDKDGYKFDGWYTDSTCTDNKITVIGSTAYTADISLYAKWTPKTWNITYKDAGNSTFSGQFSKTAPSKHTYNTETAIVNPSKTGYLFGGWYTESTCSVDENKVSTLSATGYTNNIVLYAKWTPITYTIKFNANTGSGSIEPVVFAYDEQKALTDNTTITKTGYAFAGWNTKNDGSGTHYANKASVINLTNTNGTEITLYAQWTTNTYTVAYDGNGYTGGTTERQNNHVFDSSQALTINGFVKTGYTFAGWAENNDGTGTSYTDGESVSNLSSTAGATVTLYAKWTANTYKVVFDKNGADGTQIMPDQSFTYDENAKSLSTNLFTKTGYTFAGWSTKSDGTKDYDDKASVQNLSENPNGTVTLYALWTANSYTITYNGNGSTGDSTTASSTHTYDKYKALTANGYTRKGYTFVGWTENNDGTGTNYTDGQSVCNLSSIKDYSVTLYAKWTANTYKVVFDKNGADGTQIMSDQQFTYDETAKALSENLFTKTGYTFAGWSTISGGTKVYADKTPVQNLSENPNETVTLYALWDANDYSIVFDKNGADGTQVMDNQPFTYDATAEALTINTYTRTGYTFAGWNTVANGTGTSYTNGQSVSNLSSAVNGEVNLYAQWAPITYHVAFDNNTGTGSLAIQDINYDATVNLTANNNAMTKVGYTFAGWNTQADGNGTGYADKASVNNLKAKEGETVTLYAQWTKNTYKVEFNNNGGSGSIDTQDFTYDVAANLTVNNGSMTKTGYTFNGWNTSSDGNGNSYTDGQSVSNLSAINKFTVELYAKWKANTYTITYADYDKSTFTGQFAGSVAGTHTYDTETTLTTPTKTGYTLEGWYYKDSNSTYVKLAGGKLGKTTFTSDMTIYAKWTPITYTIRFNANGDSTVAATGSISDLVATYDTAINLTKNETLGSNTVIARNYYEFAGWNTQPDGSGISYADTASVENLASTQGCVVNLYAKWTPISYTIVFNKNDSSATGSTANQKHTYGTSLALSSNGFTKTGYSFAGWATTAGGDKVYEDGQLVSNMTTKANDIINLYAKWTVNTYKVTLHPGNSLSTNFTALTSYTYGTGATLPTDGLKTEYTFGGWYTNSGCTGDAVTIISATDTGEKEYWAKWTINSYSVTLHTGDSLSTNFTALTSYTYGTGATLPTNGKKTGYSFNGWYTNSSYTGNAVTTITTTDTGNKEYWAKWTLDSKGSATVSSSAGRTSCGWVQLWEGGPKWAEFNIGATISSYTSATANTTANIGGLYTWGGNNNIRDSYTDDHNTGTDNLTNEGNSPTDTARKIWGEKWRMPTKKELANLHNKDENNHDLSTPLTTWEWCDGQTGTGHKQYVSGCTLKGYKVSGKGVYADNSIFLPINGRIGYSKTLDNNLHGYWSSTSDNSSDAYMFYSKYKDNQWSVSTTPTSESKGYGYSIRPVSK